VRAANTQSAQRESNPHFRHGKATGCRYIMGACERAELSKNFVSRSPLPVAEVARLRAGCLPNSGEFGCLPNSGEFGYLPNSGEFGYLPNSGEFGYLPNSGEFGYLPNSGEFGYPSKKPGVAATPGF
jgi:hypothetical protein